MLPGRITKVPISDEGAYIEYLADRASGREDQVAYLSEAGRAPSRWMGSGAAALGLEGDVDLDVLRAYAECRDPVTGEQLGNRLPKWGAFESPFTAPKDTSTLWAIWPKMRADIEESVWYGATAGIGRSEVEGAKYGRGSIRGEPVVYDSDGLIVAAFMHASARPAGEYQPNPHLHCHAVAVNRVFCSDGQVRSMHSDPYVRASRTATYGEALVAHRQYLTEQVGVGWERNGSGEWRIAGLDDELIKNWSRRHQQIIKDAVAAARAHLGWPPTPTPEPEDPVDLQAAAHAHLDRLAADAATRDEPPPMTAAGLEALIKSFASKVVDKRRQRKTLDEPEAERFDRWLDEASEVVDVEEVIAAVLAAGVAYRQTLGAWAWPPEQQPTPGSGPGTPAAAIEELADHLTTRTTWLHRDIVAAAAELVPPGADVRWVQFLTDAVLQSTVELHSAAEITDSHLVVTEPFPGVHRGDPTQRRWQSQRVWRAERAIERAYGLGLDARLAVAGRQAGWDKGLSKAQAAEVERVCSSGHAISCIVGPAGAGKTTLIAAAARRWQASDRPVVGLAVAGTAVQELRRAGIATSRTVSSLLTADENTRAGRRTLDSLRGAVLVLDEASMVNTLDMAEVLRRAEHAGAKVVLVGDPSQLGAIGARGMFKHLVEDLEAAQALEEVHRFRNEWEGVNSLLLRAGDTAAIDRLNDHDRITASPDDSFQADAARDFTARALNRGSVPLLMARTKRQVHDLNQAARQALKLGPVVYQRHRFDLDADNRPVIQAFAVGDIIVTGRNAPRILDTNGEQVNNGDRWRITGDGIDHMGQKVMHVERIDDDSHRARASLPEAYINGSNPDGRPWIEHGIATTAHRAQGRTVDHAMAFADNRTSRSLLYVMLSRGRYTNRLAMIDTIDHDEALNAAKATLGRIDDDMSGLAYVAQLRREAEAARVARQPPEVGAPADPDPDETAPPPDDVLAASGYDIDLDSTEVSDDPYKGPLSAFDDTMPPVEAVPEPPQMSEKAPERVPVAPEDAVAVPDPDQRVLEAIDAAESRLLDSRARHRRSARDVDTAHSVFRRAVHGVLDAIAALRVPLDSWESAAARGTPQQHSETLSDIRTRFGEYRRALDYFEESKAGFERALDEFDAHDAELREAGEDLATVYAELTDAQADAAGIRHLITDPVDTAAPEWNVEDDPRRVEDAIAGLNPQLQRVGITPPGPPPPTGTEPEPDPPKPPPGTRREFFERGAVEFTISQEKLWRRFNRLPEDPEQIAQAWKVLEVLTRPRPKPDGPDHKQSPGIDGP